MVKLLTTTVLSLLIFLRFYVSSALYEDQVGVADWHHRYIGKVKQAVFHTQKAGRKRVVVSTEENAVASLDLRRGGIFWRHILGDGDQVDQIDISLGKYVITLSSHGAMLRAWNLPDGQMVWESILQVSTPSISLLSVLSLQENIKSKKESVIIVFGGGCLHGISALDGAVIWRKDFSLEGVQIQQIYRHPNHDIICIVGFSGSSQVDVYKVRSENGEMLKHTIASFQGKLSKEALLVYDDMLVALDASKSKIVLIDLQENMVNFHQTSISDLIQGFSGEATILPSKFVNIFAVNLGSCIILIKIKGKELVMLDRLEHPALVSDGLSLQEGKQAFALVQHDENQILIKVQLDGDFKEEVLSESIEMNDQRGQVKKVFVNNYVRTDRSHGFRALLVMEDHSLLLVQQGEIVWSREDGLASIIDTTISELPVEKDGVSVSRVEHNLFEWLKGHFLRLKGTLMLANPGELAAIQGMRLKNSEKNKMTRDHNGFRKLLIVLTRAGKVLALHTGDGRVVWSTFSSSRHRSMICQHPSWLNIHQLRVPHHHALDENPSVLIVGRCDQGSDALGIISTVDSYTGKELSYVHVSHSIVHVMPLPLLDSNEQRLHLMIDSMGHAHLYPRTSDSINIFLREFANIYWYSVDRGRDIIRGHSLNDYCIDSDEYCFQTSQLWSIVFPSESEKIIATTRRKLNEVVHTQAKALGDQDVLYKYISNNVVFIATVSPKAIGEIGSTTPEEARLIVYLIDAVTGRVMHHVTHQGAQGPLHVVFSENWVVYHYFNIRAHKFEMSVMEIYDQTRADNKDVLKLMFGKHNLTSPVSSYSWPEVVVKSQSYFFTHSVKVMTMTSTVKGITSKQLLIGTISDQVLALDKRYLDPRRTTAPSQSEREEGIIPLTDSLPIIPQSYVTHSLQVEGLRDIVTIPAKLESTTLVFCYGVDLFFTRLAPSRTYDSLTEDFNYALLLITIVALVVAILVTWVLSEQKELKDRWR